MSRSETRRRWQGLISKQASSDLSIAEFCRRHDVSQASFYQWRSKLRASQSAAGSESFVPLSVIGHACVSVELPCGAVLRLPAGDERSLRQVVSLLMAVVDEDAP